MTERSQLSKASQLKEQVKKLTLGQKNNWELHPNGGKIKKRCFACGKNFLCSLVKNYDYCPPYSLNGSRYIPKENRCAECGNGSGLIKFKNQPPRNCKLYYLTNQEKWEGGIFH